MGDTHRTPGNFAFVRAFQEKTLLMAVGIPLFAGATLEFFREASARAWLLLFVTATGLIGATASTAVLLPALASLLAFAVLLTRRTYWDTIKKWVPYGASLLYVVSYAILLILFSTNDLGVDSPVNEGWPTTFWGHAGFFLDFKQPVTPVLVLVGTVVSLVYGLGEGQIFVAWWCIFALIFYVNPIVSQIHIEKLTSPNIYWRLFYVYPIIPIIGGAGFYVFDWVSQYSRRIQGALLAVTLVVMAIGHVPWFSSSSIQSNLQLPPLEYPILGDYETAERIAQVVPEGPMLAPNPITGTIAMVGGRHPQMRVRSDGAQLWLNRNEAENRISASNYVGLEKRSPSSFKSFRKVVRKEGLCSVVVDDSVAGKVHVRSALSLQGYNKHQKLRGYDV